MAEGIADGQWTRGWISQEQVNASGLSPFWIVPCGRSDGTEAEHLYKDPD